MKKEVVPQDNVGTYEGHKRLLYATDEKGHYDANNHGGVQSSGWEVEEYATLTAVDAFNRLAADALERARAGSTSPLEYHMYRSRMDIALLAQVTGLFQWRIKRHLKPRHFATLKPSLLNRYSEALGIPVTALQQLPKESA